MTTMATSGRVHSGGVGATTVVSGDGRDRSPREDLRRRALWAEVTPEENASLARLQAWERYRLAIQPGIVMKISLSPNQTANISISIIMRLSIVSITSTTSDRPNA